RQSMESPFEAFLQAAFSVVLAIVFAWRLIVFSAKEEEDDSNNNRRREVLDSPSSDVSDEMDPSVPSSLRGLLSTDVLPEGASSSSEEDDFLHHPPPPHLLNMGSLEIIHEESDEARSISSASFASPRTVLDAHPSRRSDYRSISSLSSASDYRSPTSQLSPREQPNNLTMDEEEQPQARVDTSQTLSGSEAESTSPEVTIIEKSSETDSNEGLLRGLAQLSVEPVKMATKSTEGSTDSVLIATEQEEGEEIQVEPAFSHNDADRDTTEEIVFETTRPTPMDDVRSLDSVSLVLNESRDSVLDHSITSNPIDETAIVEKSMEQRNSIFRERRDSSPPPDLPPPPPLPILTSTPRETSHASITLTHGPPPPPSSQQPVDVDVERSMQRVARYGQIYSDSAKSRMNTARDERNDQGMSSPPPAAPPLPPYSTSIPVYTSNPAGSTKSYSSRDDLLESDHAPSRSTVREIPVLRAPSAAASSVLDAAYAVQAPASTGASLASYHHSRDPSADMHDEYYRREVLTRTIITRSTEQLSNPLRSSSPIERYVTYNPSDDTREIREVEYRVNRVRDVEEEERRIFDERERRRGEEEDRRKRDEDMRREMERLEREAMERLRRDRELKERELESTRAERERHELDKLDKERRDRELLERARREDWERRENERRALEDADLDRRRQIERERLERERLIEEQRERERLEREKERLERERIEREKIERERIERERIERERIERERIEIERIERIKKEKLEKERREKEREREEAERLRKEREELERLERERRELEARERELLAIAQREAAERERERLEDEERERRRRAEEEREAAIIAEKQRALAEKERLRRQQEQEEKDRLERLRIEQERREHEKQEYERRERERQEEERREMELIEAQRRARDQRDKERVDDEMRERARQEEERRERERREKERREAMERERLRQIEEAKERDRIATLEKIAAERRYHRDRELTRERELAELEARTNELKDLERKQQERRQREREAEEYEIEQIRRLEAENRAIRDRERQAAAERDTARRLEDRRSRDKLDHIIREKTEKEKMEEAKRQLLADKEWRDRRRHDPFSKENLERLTRKPHYSRENLSQPEFVTKVERQVIERVDRNMWVDDRLIPTTYTTSSYAIEGGDDYNRDRLFSRSNEMNRAGSARTSSRLLRSRMDQARKDFLAGPDASSDAITDRFLKSTDDLSKRPAPEYRGPLLQKFHDDSFSSRPSGDANAPYPRVGPSQYAAEFEQLLAETERKYADYRSRSRSSQPNLYSRARNYSSTFLETDVDTGRPDLASVLRETEETNLDDVHRRSGSALDTERSSRRDVVDAPGAVHSRSKSADYLMDRRAREESAVPENDLQRQPRDISPHVSEHEMRFRKSTEKLDVPDWYRDQHRTTGRATDLDATLSRPGQGYRQSVIEHRPPSSSSLRYGAPFSYTDGGYQPAPTAAAPTARSPPVGGFDTRGMFDRYAGEIAEMRRSRSSLHHVGQQEQPPARQDHKLLFPEQPVPVARRSLSQEVISSTHQQTVARALPGYTVSDVPDTWEMITRNRRSRVIEVADTFVPPRKGDSSASRYGGRVTIEEVLDSIFNDTHPAPHPHPNEDTSLPQGDHLYHGNHDGPSIYTHNYMLMDQVIKRPDQAEDLLKEENLFVRCSYCHRTRELATARLQYVSCKHCYTYYCSRHCRQNDWSKHGGRCSFARINTLCKDVIMKVRTDTEAQWWMSRVAREGYSKRGRGSVNIRLASPQLAQAYVTRGWPALANYQPENLLYYYTIAALVQERKDPSLIMLCKKYDPTDKFILSVSIIADVEHCPSTPPPESSEWPAGAHFADTGARPASAGALHHLSQNIPVVDMRTLVPTDV
ncbi:hypothetical protein PFISCL1PPCAC_23210, partial [Pristionchus fissidentatus]